ncbi:tetratricopeptide repeat protein [Streptomyces sp. NPDC008137]|uniref:tetratricopeptide repeat protein n=1 Tax=Streptomyces sp. NPDC008137 TaxID=3364813 RepID=UPI0036E2F560
MSRLSREKKREQKQAAHAATPAAPVEVHVPRTGHGAGPAAGAGAGAGAAGGSDGASVGGVPVFAAPGEEIHRAVLNRLHHIALATGHAVLATIHDERIGYVVPLQVDPDGSSHFTAEPVRTTPPEEAVAGHPPQPPTADPTTGTPIADPATEPPIAGPATRQPGPGGAVQWPDAGAATEQPSAAGPATEWPPAAAAEPPPVGAAAMEPPLVHPATEPPSAAGPATEWPPAAAAAEPPPADAAPEAPAPGTPAPGTPAPGTPAPGTPAPATPGPMPPAAGQQPSRKPPHSDSATHVLRPVPESDDLGGAPTFRLRAVPESPAPEETPPGPAAPGRQPGTVAPPTGAFGPPPPMDARPLPVPGTAPAAEPRRSMMPDPVLEAELLADLDAKPTPARGFDAVAEAMFGDEPVGSSGDSGAPDLVAEPITRINEAVKEGRIEVAAGLAEQTVAQASAALGPEHPEVLRLGELSAYIAYLAGDPLRAFRLSLDLAGARRRSGDAEAAYGNVQSAATAWRAVRDPAVGLELGRDLIGLWTELAAEDGPAADEIEQLESARARMGRLTERARGQ